MAALAGLGYKMKPLDVPDNEALRYGKEFGNRGQCNPTYFTVGNLVKHLVHLARRREDVASTRSTGSTSSSPPARAGRAASAPTSPSIGRRSAMPASTASACCCSSRTAGSSRPQARTQDSSSTARFFTSLLTALIAGDVVNLVGYRIRPYEVEPGSTDRALEACKQIVHIAIETHTSVVMALYRCRRILNAVAVNRLQPKPKVAIIGEFWAMTTEGDGNYKLQRFLEAEGAEVDIQPVTAWLLYSMWQKDVGYAPPHDAETRRHAGGAD